MRITPIEIQQRQFTTRFRGFDVREVEAFLEQLTQAFENLTAENRKLRGKIDDLKSQKEEHKVRHRAVENTLENNRKSLALIKENARKSAELITSHAEVRAEKILNRANNRLVQIHEDIGDLKRQRTQLELQIRFIIENHTKLLDQSSEEMKTADEDYNKIRFLKKAT